jgi:hypothetical protein
MAEAMLVLMTASSSTTNTDRFVEVLFCCPNSKTIMTDGRLANLGGNPKNLAQLVQFFSVFVTGGIYVLGVACKAMGFRMVAILCLAVSCGGGTAKNEPATPAKLLVLVPTTLSAGAGSIVMRADGVVREAGRLVGTIYPDGRFVDKSGEVLAVLAEDGSITDGKGQAVPDVRIERDGTFLFMGRTISFSDDGRLLGVEGAAHLRVRISDAAGRRAAAFLLVVAVLSASGRGERPSGQ